MKLYPRYLKRYKDVAGLCIKYARPGLFSRFHSENGEDEPLSPKAERAARDLPDDLERLGPTFVKIGQLLSSRPDLLPEHHRHMLERLQDRVRPFPYSQVEIIVANELGVPISSAFSSFDPSPVAAASLGQVHRAVLRDGRPVVVKVQRPNIRQQLDEDFQALREVAKLLHAYTLFGHRYQLVDILDEFEGTVVQEIDYRQEAANMITLANNMKEFPRVIIPLPVQRYCTDKVLTMDRIEGIKITELTPLQRTDFDGASLTEEVFRAYLKQVMVDGVFHADPHPGNVFLTPDYKLALLDLGMVGRLTPSMRESLLKLLLAVSEGAGDDAATIAISIGDTGDDFDELNYRHRSGQAVVKLQNSPLETMDIGRTILEISRCAAECRLHLPAELALLGKTLLQLDQVGRSLDPRFNPSEIVRRHASEILSHHIKSGFTEGKFYSGLLEARQFVGALPTRVNRILDSLGKAEVKLKINTTETQMVMEGFQKIANRITAGVIFGALIVGAALLTHVDTPFRLLGYPGLAMICFIIAVFGGMVMVLSILWQDFKGRQRIRK